ncbi:hypothetical protein C1646_749954 [Rhizophagus diaphanus]|nr:hypothetical protein C1646_749954 [Rhizophagus diaphanus] [Rhizophagus sp. MUCL 43196]
MISCRSHCLNFLFEECIPQILIENGGIFSGVTGVNHLKTNKKLTAEINKINTADIAIINARIEIFVVEAQSILDRINNIEQNVNDLYEEKRRREEANRVNHFVSTVQSEIAQG